MGILIPSIIQLFTPMTECRRKGVKMKDQVYINLCQAMAKKLEAQEAEIEQEYKEALKILNEKYQAAKEENLRKQIKIQKDIVKSLLEE